MIPILFSYDTVDFSSHGIGDLMDTISCVTELNEDGEYELELEYPADGRYIHDLAIDNLIYVKADDHGPYQAFRIYSIEKAINSLVTVHGQHISYDLSCYPVRAYEAKTCHTAITYLIPYAISQETIPFSITTDVTEEAQNEDRKFKLEEPKSIRAALLDGDDSIKGTFGGDLIFNNFNVSLKKIGGADRGVLVEYGIDLIDMNQEENISEMITGVYPYWKGRDLTYDENGNLVSHQDKDGETIDKIIYGTVQYAAGTFRRHRVIPLNVTEYCVNLFDAEGNDREPTVAEINQIARDWIEANEIGEPEISLTISYANLKKDVRMHDAITVRFVKLGIDVKAKVVSYKYDTLKERCIQVTVGKAKPSILFDLEDASRLKRGLIPPKRIQNRSITSDKIETRAITPDVIDYNAIQPQHIEPQAVETLQLSEGIQEQLGYAELFNAATLEDPDPAMIPEQFSAQELRVLDEDGNLLSEMSAEGIAAQNFNVLNADGSSAISMSGSGMHISNLLDVGETIRAKHIYASVIMESPLYSLPTAEGAAEQSVNKHTHELSADDNGKVTIGAPDFTGAEHFFNIADTKFYKDRMSAIKYEVTEGNVEEDGMNPYNANSNPNIFNVLATFKVDGNYRSYTSFVNVYKVYNAGKLSAPYEITEGNVEEDGMRQYDASSNPNIFNVLATFKVDGHYKSYTSFVNVSKVYQAGQSNADAPAYKVTDGVVAPDTRTNYKYDPSTDPNKLNVISTFNVDGFSRSFYDWVNVATVYQAGKNNAEAPPYNVTDGVVAPDTRTNYKYNPSTDPNKLNVVTTFKVDGYSKTFYDWVNVAAVYSAGQNNAPVPPYNVTDGVVAPDTRTNYKYNPSTNPNKLNVVTTFKVDGNNKTFYDWVNVAAVYNAGITKGKTQSSIDHIKITYSLSSNGRYYQGTATAYADANETTALVSTTKNTGTQPYSSGQQAGISYAENNMKAKLYFTCNGSARIGGVNVYHHSVYAVAQFNGKEYWSDPYYVYLTYEVNGYQG